MGIAGGLLLAGLLCHCWTVGHEDTGRGKMRLSDEEQAELDRQNQRIQLSQEPDRSRRRRLTLLTAVCVLLPPLWPVAFGLSFYLLFPQTAARIGLVAGVVLLLGGLAVAVALALVTLGLLQLLF